MKIQMRDYEEQMNEAIKQIGENRPFDLTIISSDKEEIQTKKYFLALFSPTLSPLLSSSCCSTSTSLFLPDFSSFSIKSLIHIISNGVSFGETLSWNERLEIIDLGKILLVENLNLFKTGEECVEEADNKENINSSVKKQEKETIERKGYLDKMKDEEMFDTFEYDFPDGSIKNV